MSRLAFKCPAQGLTLETLAAHLQTQSTQYLYVIDGSTLHYYSSLEEIPSTPRTLEEISTRQGRSTYRIRDTTTGSQFTCFSERFKNRLINAEPPTPKLPPPPLHQRWVKVKDSLPSPLILSPVGPSDSPAELLTVILPPVPSAPLPTTKLHYSANHHSI